jgi:hypothetical protein
MEDGMTSVLEKAENGARAPAATGFCEAQQHEPRTASVLRVLIELLLLGILAMFVRSPGALAPQHRLLLGLAGAATLLIGWAVLRRHVSGVGWRVWLMFTAGFALSLAVVGQNLQRPPAPLAWYCALGVGVVGAALAVAAFTTRHPGLFVPTGAEPAILAACAIAAALIVVLYPSVAAQNTLDTEVLHNTLRELAGYTLLMIGVSAASSSRSSFFRMAVVIGAAFLVRMALHHGGMAPQ